MRVVASYLAGTLVAIARPHNRLGAKTTEVTMWKRIKWILRGKPTKKVIGGWCGCCGAWLETAEFTFPDYWFDNFFDLNTICPKGCSRTEKQGKA